MISKTRTLFIVLFFSIQLFAQTDNLEAENTPWFAISCEDSFGEKGYMVWEKNGESMITAEEKDFLVIEGQYILGASKKMKTVYELLSQSLGQETMDEMLIHSIDMHKSEETLIYDLEYFLPSKQKTFTRVVGIKTAK